MKNEVIRLQMALRIPVSNISFHDGYVSVCSNSKHIGNLRTSGDDASFNYDLGENAVSALDWHLVFTEHKENIMNHLRLMFDNSLRDDQVTAGAFGKLYVRQSDQSVRVVDCFFEDGEWKLALEDY